MLKVLNLAVPISSLQGVIIVLGKEVAKTWIRLRLKL